MSKFRFCDHAKSKFNILREHGFSVSRKKVIDAIKNYDKKEKNRNNRIVFQKRFNEEHVLRVICEKNNGKIIVITFYPGRRSYYES